LQTFRPAFDDTLERELRRLASSQVAAVKLHAIQQCAAIVHDDGIRLARAFAAAFRQHEVLQTTGRGDDTFFGGVFSEKGFSEFESR
jgi:hypothetical protein